MQYYLLPFSKHRKSIHKLFITLTAQRLLQIMIFQQQHYQIIKHLMKHCPVLSVYRKKQNQIHLMFVPGYWFFAE